MGATVPYEPTAPGSYGTLVQLATTDLPTSVKVQEYGTYLVELGRRSGCMDILYTGVCLYKIICQLRMTAPKTNLLGRIAPIHQYGTGIPRRV